MKNGYELFVRPLLFSLDAETAHHVTMRLLGQSSQFDVALRALRFFQPTPKPITRTVSGLSIESSGICASARM